MKSSIISITNHRQFCIHLGSISGPLIWLYCALIWRHCTKGIYQSLGFLPSHQSLQSLWLWTPPPLLLWFISTVTNVALNSPVLFVVDCGFSKWQIEKYISQYFSTKIFLQNSLGGHKMRDKHQDGAAKDDLDGLLGWTLGRRSRHSSCQRSWVIWLLHP